MISDDESPSRGVSERERLVNAHHQASRDFDRTVMTLAAGALGLSIAFMKDIAAPNPKAVPALALAWCLFAISLLLILVSFLTSQAALLRQMGSIDETQQLSTSGGSYGQATLWLNLGGAGTLVVGVLFLVLFAIKNL